MVKSMDILASLANGEITIAEGYDIYNQIMESHDAPRAASLLGLSPTEWTAWGQGLPFEVLAQWRTGGWPQICAICGQQIEIAKFGWFVREEEDVYRLEHIDCPGSSPRSDSEGAFGL
jgi:hypothetical protein